MEIYVTFRRKLLASPECYKLFTRETFNLFNLFTSATMENKTISFFGLGIVDLIQCLTITRRYGHPDGWISC